jgi:hypothetical protein
MKKSIAQSITQRRRRRFLTFGFWQTNLLWMAVLFSFLPSCSHVDTAEPRTVIIFVDLSLSSLPERENYKRYIEKVASKLAPGDRVAVGKIIDLTIADFVPIADVAIPAFNFWTDNRTLHKKLVDEITSQLFANIDSVLDSRGKIERSEIINAFLISEQFLRKKSGRKSLIILSDMLECSSEYNFEREELTNDYVEKAIQSLRYKGRIPRLDHVEVWVAGAFAKTTEKYFAVQTFWNRYIRETGADCRSYSHALLDFE